MLYKQYFTAQSIEEATRLLQREENSQLIAGGTDLMVSLPANRHPLRTLIDVSRVKEMKSIKLEDNEIAIGASVTYQEIIDSSLLHRLAPILIEASKKIGAAQIQHMGTIGGNIANASPAGDLLPPLHVLEAELLIIGPNSSRIVPINEFILGVRKTMLKKTEIIQEIRFCMPSSTACTAFVKFGLRQSQAISVVNAAVMLDIKDSIIQSARIALGAVAPTILRCTEAEENLLGKSPSMDLFEQASDLAQHSIHPIDDIRGGKDFRTLLVKALVKQALELAYTRCVYETGSQI